MYGYSYYIDIFLYKWIYTHIYIYLWIHINIYIDRFIYICYSFRYGSSRSLDCWAGSRTQAEVPRTIRQAFTRACPPWRVNNCWGTQDVMLRFLHDDLLRSLHDDVEMTLCKETWSVYQSISSWWINSSMGRHEGSMGRLYIYLLI